MAISDKTSTPPAAGPKRTTGLSPKEQKLLALREKLAAQGPGGTKPAATAGSTGSFHAKGTVPRKSAFQRKAT